MNPNTEQNWTFVNECLRHHKKVPNLSKVINSHNYTIRIDNDTLNAIHVISAEGKTVLQEIGVPYIRTKHDSILVFTGTIFVFMHFCTGGIFRFAGAGLCPFFISADVFYDPLNSRVRLWVWDGSYLTSHGYDRIVNRYQVNEPSDGYMHVVDAITCIYSSRNRMSIYNDGKLIHEVHNPRIMISQMSYLYNINRYFIQNDRYFVILQKHEIFKLFERFDDELLQFDSNKFVYFTKYQDIVMYESDKYLCIAQTIPPYKLNITRLGDTLMQVYFDDTKLHIQTLKYIHLFSMFPISFTDSTNIDTTFE